MRQRVIISILIATMTVSYAQGQLTFGARAGVNFSSMTGKWDKENASRIALPGFQAGIVGEYTISKALSVQPALIFALQGSSIKADGSTMKSHINYLQVPINVLYKFDLDGPNFFLQAGPYLGYAINGTYNIKTEGVSGSENVSFGSGDDDVKRFDLGAGIGAGLEYSNIQVTVGYSRGVVNLNNVKGFNSKNKGWWLSLSYFFL